MWEPVFRYPDAASEKLEHRAIAVYRPMLQRFMGQALDAPAKISRKLHNAHRFVNLIDGENAGIWEKTASGMNLTFAFEGAAHGEQMSESYH